MILIAPFLLMILHFSQIGFTEDLTFIWKSSFCSITASGQSNPLRPSGTCSSIRAHSQTEIRTLGGSITRSDLQCKSFFNQRKQERKGIPSVQFNNQNGKSKGVKTSLTLPYGLL